MEIDLREICRINKLISFQVKKSSASRKLMKQKKEKFRESDEDSNPGPIGPAPHPNSEKKTTENNIQLIIKNTLSAPPPPPPPRNQDEKVKSFYASAPYYY